MTVHLIYHDDPDGQLSALIAAEHERELKCRRCAQRMQFHPVMYGDPVPRVEPGDTVYVLDFSYDEEDFLALYTACEGELIWIDHHKSAMEKLAKPHEFRGIRCSRWAACALTWFYLKEGQEEFTQRTEEALWARLPRVVQLVGDYDCWRWKQPDYDPLEAREVELFQYGLKVCDGHPLGGDWQKLCASEQALEECMVEGDVIRRYQQVNAAWRIRKHAWTGHWEALQKRVSFIALNHAGSSIIWEHVSFREAYDLTILYSHDGEKYTVQLRSRGTGLAKEFAVANGGGGHPDAGGFTCTELPFKFERRHEE